MRHFTSPYLRIADDIRRKIDRGELAVGARVPSTREVARRWKVATATAAHALTALARDGVIRSVPRVGSVVASPHTRASSMRVPSEGGLTRARIVDAAIALADAEGLSAVSLRGVAARVEAPVMSLYRHVRSKDELLLWMTDAALGEERLPTSRPKGWRKQLEMGARLQWRVFRRHPWLARLVHLTRPAPLPNAIAYAEWMFRGLEDTRADAGTKMRIHVIVHGYIQGIAVNIEAEADAAGSSGMTDAEWMAGQTTAFAELAASGRHPAFAKVLTGLPDGFEIDFDELFERGLAALLDGFAADLDRVLLKGASS